MNRFRSRPETKFGMKPQENRINYETLDAQTTETKEILAPVAIWDSLGITETEYYEKYHKQSVPVNAIILENKLTLEE